MSSEEFGKGAKEIGTTAACVNHGIKATEHIGTRLESCRDAKKYDKTEKFTGDSWFVGVKAAKAAAKKGHMLFGPVKTNTSGFPKNEFDEWMKDAPSGSHIVMICKMHHLFAVGYKYSLRSKGMFNCNPHLICYGL